jgi:hypothetical protein
VFALNVSRRGSIYFHQKEEGGGFYKKRVWRRFPISIEFGENQVKYNLMPHKQPFSLASIINPLLMFV